jgi:hypothetical protein
MRAFRARILEDSGIALISVMFLMALFVVVATSLTSLTSFETTRSGDTIRANNALQAAEAGMNVYIADLTEDTGFFLDYIAAGEARRTHNGAKYPTTAGANANTNVALSPSWGRTATWTYPSDITTDPGWRTLTGTSYQYLIEVFPDSSQPNDIRVVAIGRPTPSNTSPASDTSEYAAVESYLNALSISDFQMLSASDFSYASSATTNGWVYATDNDSGTPAWVCSDGTATADLFTENTLSSYVEKGSGCNGKTTLVSPAREYASNSSPSIRTVINQPITFSDLRESPQIVASGGGDGAIQLDAISNGIDLEPTTNVPNAWWFKFQTGGTVQVYSCMKAYTKQNNVYTYYPVEYSQPTCTLYHTYTLNSTTTDIYTPEDVIVSGTVDGQVTIYTPGGGKATSGDDSYANGDVVIGDNISYQTPGSDVLGLVANENLIIACWEPENNLSWTGASIELNGRWEADSDTTLSPRCTTTHNSMTFTGSTAVYGGSSMSATFNTRTYDYDPTLRYLPPPDYPQIPSAFKVMYERQVNVP